MYRCLLLLVLVLRLLLRFTKSRVDVGRRRRDCRLGSMDIQQGGQALVHSVLILLRRAHMR